MKRISHLKAVGMMVVVLASSIIVQSCQNFEKIVEDVDLYLETDALLNPLTIQIMDSELAYPIPEDIKVEVLGKDTEKIYTVLGESDLQVDLNREDAKVGILQIGLLKADDPTIKEPIDFTLAISASGFETSYRTFSLRNSRGNLETIKLYRSEADYEGITDESQTLRVSEKGTEGAQVLRASLEKRFEEVAVEIPSATRLFGRDDQSIRGEMEARVRHYDVQESEALTRLPGGGEAIAYDEAGALLGDVNLAPISAMSVSLSEGDKRVVRFSESAKLSFTLDGNAVNPITEQPLRAGDRVNLWRFDRPTGSWIKQQSKTIEQNSLGQLVVKTNVEKPSTYILGAALAEDCMGQISLNVSSGIMASDPQRFYYTEIQDLDGNLLFTRSFRYVNGEQLDIRFKLLDEVRLAIYSGINQDCRGDLLFRTGVLDLCPGAVEPLDVSAELTGDDLLEASVRVRGTCSTDFNNLIISPTIPILFREKGCEQYALLGFLISGEGSTSALLKGKRYDYRIAYRGLDRCLLDVPVPQQDSSFVVDSPVYEFQQDIIVDYMDTDGDGIDDLVEFDYQDVEIPDLACQEYLDAFRNGVIGTGRPRDGEDDDG